MNILMWALAGAIIGWSAFTLLQFNQKRGLAISMAVGAVGGIFGGQVLAPMLSGAPAIAGAFDFWALFIAGAGAAACLAIGNMVQNRFGV
jgi:uncharacterized membrane protein YeaQ/YmgE (transglycosylase-associated protein family)